MGKRSVDLVDLGPPLASLADPGPARAPIRSVSMTPASPEPNGWSSSSRIASTTSFWLIRTICSFDRSSSARGIVGRSTSRRPVSGITWQKSSRS